jgi:hypothetical protein
MQKLNGSAPITGSFQPSIQVTIPSDLATASSSERIVIKIGLMNIIRPPTPCIRRFGTLQQFAARPGTEQGDVTGSSGEDSEKNGCIACLASQTNTTPRLRKQC